MNTILEELDEPEADVSELVIPFTAITFCPDCGHVDDVLETLRNSPCKTCGLVCDTRCNLFGAEQVDLLQTIFECFRSTTSKLCVLLFCALMERHLSNLLFGRCRRIGIDWQIIDFLLDRYWKFDQRVRLFRQLIDLPAEKVFTDTETKSIFDSYGVLRQKRNMLAHSLPGSSYCIERSEIRQAVQLAAESFSAFALLHHQYCSLDSPGLPVN